MTATDQLGRTTSTTSDPLGRPISEVGPTGVTKLTTHDDVANSVTTSTIPNNATDRRRSPRPYDDAGRQISARTSYPVPGGRRPLFLVDPISRTNFDGIGRPTTVTSANLTTVPNYAGPGGVSTATTVTPTAANQAPGDPITITPTTMLNSGGTLRTMQQGSQPAQAGIKATYDAVGNVVNSTDPNGKRTDYTYTVDGRLNTRTSPSGTVTTNNYDPTTGHAHVGRRDPNGDRPDDDHQLHLRPGRQSGRRPGEDRHRRVRHDHLRLRRRPQPDLGHLPGRREGHQRATATTGGWCSSTDVTGAVTSYAYNPDSTLLKSAPQVRGGATLASVSYTYDGLGRVKTTTRGNGLTTTNTYTPDNLLATPDHHRQERPAGRGAQLRLRQPPQPDHATYRQHREAEPVPGRLHPEPDHVRHLHHDVRLRRLRPADRVGGLLRQPTGRRARHGQLDYALDVSGNVTTTTRTTRTTGPRPITVTKLTTTDTIDAAGQLTPRIRRVHHDSRPTTPTVGC